MTHVSKNLLWSYLEDALDDDERDLVDEHLEECDDCVELLAEVAALGVEDVVRGSHQENGWIGPEPLITAMPALDLERPSTGFADRVMDAVLESGREELAAAKVVPMPKRRISPKFEVFTRFITAAAVTGFMMLGTYEASKVEQFPVVGALQEKVEDVTVDTALLYVNIQVWMDSLSAKLSN
jgi:anti-sigma factor RsiW